MDLDPSAGEDNRGAYFLHVAADLHLPQFNPLYKTDPEQPVSFLPVASLLWNGLEWIILHKLVVEHLSTP